MLNSRWNSSTRRNQKVFQKKASSWNCSENPHAQIKKSGKSRIF